MPKRLTVSISPSYLPSLKRQCHSPMNKESREPGAVSEITPLLYISDDRVSNSELTNLGITAIIDCRTEAERSLRGLAAEGLEGITRLHLAIQDNKAEDIARFFPTALHFIEQQAIATGKVLVHCTRGISRSSAIVCAYLIWSQDLSYRDAMTILKLNHPAADPNPSFSMQLVEFAISKSKDILAYELSNDGKTLTGPLSKESVDDFIAGNDGVLLVVSKTENCQYIWSAKGFQVASLEPARKTADMLALIRMAPKRIEYVQALECSPIKERFMEALTCL